MAVDYTTFGAQQSQAQQAKPQLRRNGFGSQSQRDEDFVPAKFWLNIGYTVTVELEDGTTAEKFISLPKGIGLDTMTEAKGETSGSPIFAFMAAAKNELWKQILAEAQKLAPDEERILPGSICGLQFQLRHARDRASEVAPGGVNPFVRAIAFTA